MTDDDFAPGSGVLRYLVSGLQPTLEDLAWLMILVSDNIATQVLLRGGRWTGDRERANYRARARLVCN